MNKPPLTRRPVLCQRVARNLYWGIGVSIQWRDRDGHSAHYGYPYRVRVVEIQIGRSSWGFGFNWFVTGGKGDA